MTWRKWLLWGVMPIYLAILLSAYFFSAAVVHAIGVEVIRSHALLAVVICVGGGVVIGIVPVIIDSLQRPRKASTTSAIVLLITGCLILGLLSAQIAIYLVIFRNHNMYSNVRLDLLSLFNSGVMCTVFLLSGISQLRYLRRQQQAQPSSSIA